ncbi:MAG TPA: hypothetical protein ENI20_18275 [Bacteroides sp.]|nr:hypothetical protein [Bacteroides sp.]
MKKLSIITAILLLAVSAFSQPNSKARDRQKVQDHKSEASVRRTVHNPKSDVVTKRTVQNHKSEAYRTKAVRSNRSAQTSNSRHSSPNTFANNNSRTGTKVNTKGVVRTTGQHRKGNTAYHVPSRYRKVHHDYRVPGHANVTWSDRMYREYRVLYPDFHSLYYPSGYRIATIPTYRAYFHIGEVRNVYGRIHKIWYSWKTDEYYLYFGNTYPYQDFTVILPGNQARRFNRNPELYFSGRYIWVTGLVSTFNGRPEIMVMRKHQVHLY